MRPAPGAPVRLLEFMTSFTAGGTERQIVNLMKGLDRVRFALAIGCQMRSGKFLDEVLALGAPLREYPISSFKDPRTLRQVARLARDLRHGGTQIVHSHNFYANVFAVPAARLARTPVVIASVRDMGVYQTPPQRVLHRIACALADRIVVNADAIRSSLVAQGLDGRKISVIRNGLDMTPFAARRGATAVRQELGVPATAPLVVLVARLNALKGVEDFLQAGARVAAAVPDSLFVVVGDDWLSRGGEVVADTAYRRALAAQVDALGLARRVVFTGYRRDVPALLAEAALSVLPSHSEGLSNTLLESMAAGAPVVATNVGGNPEVVRHGVTGLLVPPRAPEALAEAIIAVLTDRALADRFGRAGRRRVLQEFSLERTIAATQDLYLDLLARRIGSPVARAAAEPPPSPEDVVPGADRRWSAR
ncbi:MAG: glycosyltransferase [Candidatus Rokubacteria bacterium]|nr:glycosyltransferase [Candidatus Rokubacteria bacterium]